MTHLIATVPVKIESTANKREHWRSRAARAASHRMAGWVTFRHHGVPADWCYPLRIGMTRIAPRELDSDNLAISFKSIRDGIADWLGVNDNDKRITWEYSQEKGAPKYYACRIEITTKEYGSMYLTHAERNDTIRD